MTAHALLFGRARRDASCPCGWRRELTPAEGAGVSRERRRLLLAAFRVHLLVDAPMAGP